MNHQQIVVIATSAPTDRSSYRREFLKCFCYPKDTVIRFTYRKRWIDPNLLQQASKTLPEKMLALILFCDKRDQDSFRYIPIRLAYIQAIGDPEFRETSIEDTYLSISVKLDRFVRYLPPEEIINQTSKNKTR